MYRKVVLALLTVQTIGIALLVISLFVTGSSRDVIIGTGIAFVFYSGLLAAYWRGWDAARYLAIMLATIATIIVLPEPYLTQEVSYTLLVAPVQALILSNGIWVVGSALVTYGGILVKAGGHGIYASPVTLVLFALIIGGISLGHFLASYARRMAEVHARNAEASVRRAEELAQEATLMATALSEKSTELQQRNAEQQRLIDLVTALETPTLALANGILLTMIVRLPRLQGASP